MMDRVKACTVFQRIAGTNGQTIQCWNTTAGDLKIIIFTSDKVALHAMFTGDDFPNLDMCTNAPDTISSFKVKLKGHVLYPAIVIEGIEYYSSELSSGFYVMNNEACTDITIYTKDEVFDMTKKAIYGNQR